MVWESWSFPSAQHCRGHSCSARAVLGSPVLEMYCRDLQRATKVIEGQKSLFLRGKAERAGTPQPGWEKAQGIPSMSTNMWRKGVKRVEPGSARTRGNENKLDPGRFPLSIRKLFCCDGEWVLAQVAQKGLLSLHHWRYSTAIWIRCCPIASMWSCSSGVVEQDSL